MELGTTAVLAAMIKKIVDFLKYAANRDVNAVVTQITSWAAGVAVTFLVAHSDFAGGVAIHGTLMSNLNNWSVALIGVNLASLAGVGWDAIKAIDNTNSAVVPDLLPTVVDPAP